MSTCIIQLGRAGDIINILPVALAEAQSLGEPVAFMVHPQYVGILDGVSYAWPVPFAGEVTEIRRAIAEAQAMGFDRILDTQVYGDRPIARLCDSFAHESWRLAGRLDQWDELPLVFDERQPDREAQYVGTLALRDPFRGRLGFDGRPIVALCTEGVSSPLGRRDWLAEQLAAAAPEFQWLSIDGARAPQIYDVLGFLERAAALVTIDTAMLHLSYAVGVPTFALVTDGPTPWHGTAPRKHWIGSLRYDEIEARWTEIVDAVRAAIAPTVTR